MAQRILHFVSNPIASRSPGFIACATQQEPGATELIQDQDTLGRTIFEACSCTIRRGGWAIWKSFLRGCELAAHTRAPIYVRDLLAQSANTDQRKQIHLRAKQSKETVRLLSRYLSSQIPLLAGQSVGLVGEIRPAADILRETVNGAERFIQELSAKALSIRA